MPSPRSPRSRPQPRVSALRRASALALAAALLAACSSGRPAAVRAPQLPAVAADLLPPSTGYPLTADDAALRAVDAAFESLRHGDTGAARREAESRLRNDPGFHPASVLLGQADLLAASSAAAVDRLRPVVAELPGYVAAQVALGAAALEAGEIPTAFVAFSAAAGAAPPAAARAHELRPRALEIARHRLDEALARGRHADAEAQLTFLERWAPDDEATWTATREVARAARDERRELMAVRRLAGFPGAQRELKENLAQLEVEAGDAAAGVRLYEELLRRAPGDASLEERLAWAKYRFRLQLLPAAVRSLAEQPQLSRGGFAVLLYWLAPDVRYGRGGAVRIATDILEAEHREEIVRVLNLGLLDVDETLHKFYPDGPIARGDALAALLRLLADRGRVACVLGLPSRSIGRETACGLAAACGLAGEAAGCLPGAPLAGADAADLIQRALELAPPR